MADNSNNPTIKLEGGTYEIIRNRLLKQGEEMRNRLQQLNEARKNVFGAIETQLIANDRINTNNFCIARDIVAIGKRCLFGYNVHIGLRSGIQLSDVFSVYTFEENRFHKEALSFISDERFLVDFNNLYRYYKETTFSKFAVIGGYLYMVFQVSKNVNDIKAFKWLIQEEGLVYVDARSEHEFRFPTQHEFQWVRAGRDNQRQGKHPHISIMDRLFVETIGGDLTIKVEDNTDDGLGIYQEAVEHLDQTLDDAEYFYTDLGNLIVLKIKPFQEEARYFVFNEKIQSVVRIDTLAEAAVMLPDNHGIIFSNGYYLQSGDYKIFELEPHSNLFERRITSPNGEDYCYVFYSKENSQYILMAYNVIEQAVGTPIVCNGYTLFPNGELCYFRSEAEPTKHHVVQIWQTPFIAGDFIPSAHTESYLYKVGNKDIVKVMAECTELQILLNKDDAYAGLYHDLSKKASDILDAYYWIDREEAFQLDEPIAAIKDAATSAIEEFEKVQRIKKNTANELEKVQKESEALFEQIKRTTFDHINLFVEVLAHLRRLRGATISLKELRYIDLTLVDLIEGQIAAEGEELSQACIEFLLSEDALNPYVLAVSEAHQSIPAIQTVVQANELGGEIDQIGADLQLLIEIVSNLKIEDSTQTTRIIESISNIFATLNQAKAAQSRKRKSLLETEAVAEFGAQIKLLDQGIVNYLEIADTPQQCDELLTKLVIQLEEMEGKFAEFETFIGTITEKREEIYNAFESRKLSLVEARGRRSAALESAGQRILNGISNRLKTLESVDDINGFFAADLMIEKVRDIIQQLSDIEDTVKADALMAQLKTLKSTSIRQLKDRQDLFVDGSQVIQFGKHKFSVNNQSLDLTLIIRHQQLFYHLTGTNFFQPVEDPALTVLQSVWDQALISENPSVYRGEYLAYQVFKQIQENKLTGSDIQQSIKDWAAKHYQEGYAKGIHDEDALLIVQQVLKVSEKIDLLRYAPSERACGAFFWHKILPAAVREELDQQLKSAGIILQVFPNTHEFDYLIYRLETLLQEFLEAIAPFKVTALRVAQYLFAEMSRGDQFIVSKMAADLKKAFEAFIRKKKAQTKFQNSLDQLNEQPIDQYQMSRKWAQAYLEQLDQPGQMTYLDELAFGLMSTNVPTRLVNANPDTVIKGLHGSHPIIEDGVYHLNYNGWVRKMEDYLETVVPQYLQYHQLKKSKTAAFKQKLRLDEFKPRVLSSFVRNQLIDQVYLPIFGDNLAKQIGAVGEQTRTDRMGMLLLISPPGYGKTTLMEYISNRLGLIFMKINGPAIGHQVTSLDPQEAKNAAARQELQKLNLALEMGDNIMLYLDDIQHCHPEFLQKFISLTDAQRKIEGVYNGVTKTYDLKGKKVCVVMAGNPYTESGEKFRIPDMLANRSDIYNLGDIIGDTKAVFEMSYIENALTSNPVLQQLANKNIQDIYPMLKLAKTGSQEGLEFQSNHGPEEINEYVSVLQKMIQVRDVILKVNLTYIESAAQSDEYRTEPPFLLQGSYRNMNKLAEKIVPIMDDKELKTLILSHYEGEAQTLTSGTEANMLKFKELIGWLSETEQQRWNEIKKTYGNNKVFRGQDKNDPIVQVIAQLGKFSEGLDGIRSALEKDD